MASNVVSIAIQSNSDSLTKAFDKGATAGERFKGKMELVAKAVVAAMAFKAAQAVKDFVGDSVRAFSDLNESLNAVEVTYGDAAEGIKKLGEDAAGSLGLSNAEFNSFAVQMSAFAKEIAGDGGDVVGVVDDLSTRVSDFASVMNLDVADAAVKFQSGLAGETEPLRKFGIDVSAARVEMFALSEGIIEAGETMTEAEKIQARYGTIMEQTAETAGDFANTIDDYANAQRVANAEMENAKARSGEAFIPVAQLGNELKSGLAVALGSVATGFQQLKGDLTAGQAAVQQFGIRTGEATDEAATAVLIMRDYGTAAEDLVPALGLSREELEKLIDADEDFLKSMGLTEDQIKDLADAARRELVNSFTEGEQATRDFYNAQQDLGDETANTTGEIKTQADTLRAQTDPLFGAMKAAEALEEAQRELNDAIVQYGEDSDEARDAAGDLASANADLIGILEDLKADGIDPTGEAARGMLEGMGIPPGVINSLFSEFDRIESNFEGRTFKMNVSAPSIEYQQRANKVTPVTAREIRLHSGGIVPEGLLDGNRSSRREAVVPLDTQEGKRALAQAVAEAMGGTGGGITVNVTAGLGANGDEIGQTIIEVLERWKRRNGVAVP